VRRPGGALAHVRTTNVPSTGESSVRPKRRRAIDGFTANGIKVGSGVVFVRNTTISNNVTAGITITSGYVGLADVALVLNGTALVGAPSVQSIGNVYMYGNKTGDAKPVR